MNDGVSGRSETQAPIGHLSLRALACSIQLEDSQGKAMRIHIHAQEFDLTPQLRAFVEARLLGALDQFRDRIEFVRVHLRTRIGGNEPDATGCEVVARFRPAGEVRVRTEYPEMQVSIARAAQAIRAAVERQASQPSLVPGPPPVTGDTTTDDGSCSMATGSRNINERCSRDQRTTCGRSAFASIGGHPVSRRTRCRRNLSTPWPVDDSDGVRRTPKRGGGI